MSDIASLLQSATTAADDDARQGISVLAAELGRSIAGHDYTPAVQLVAAYEQLDLTGVSGIVAGGLYGLVSISRGTLRSVAELLDDAAANLERC